MKSFETEAKQIKLKEKFEDEKYLQVTEDEFYRY